VVLVYSLLPHRVDLVTLVLSASKTELDTVLVVVVRVAQVFEHKTTLVVKVVTESFQTFLVFLTTGLVQVVEVLGNLALALVVVVTVALVAVAVEAKLEAVLLELVAVLR
jgi:hypothetical protein